MEGDASDQVPEGTDRLQEGLGPFRMLLRLGNHTVAQSVPQCLQELWGKILQTWHGRSLIGYPLKPGWCRIRQLGPVPLRGTAVVTESKKKFPSKLAPKREIARERLVRGLGDQNHQALFRRLQEGFF